MIAWMFCKSPFYRSRKSIMLTALHSISLVYILAIPAFSFFLPLYSFWYMDNFSWGNTRVVLGESGKKVVIHVSDVGLIIPYTPTERQFGSQDEGKFDPRSIPEKSWREYECVQYLRLDSVRLADRYRVQE